MVGRRHALSLNLRRERAPAGVSKVCRRPQEGWGGADSRIVEARHPNNKVGSLGPGPWAACARVQASRRYTTKIYGYALFLLAATCSLQQSVMTAARQTRPTFDVDLRRGHDLSTCH